MSMRSRVIAAFALCVSLPLAAGAIALWSGSESTLRQSTGDELRSSARSVMTQVEAQMAMSLTHLRAWSSLPVMQDVLLGEEGQDLQQAITDLNLSYTDFASIVVTNVQGTVVATSDASFRHAELGTSEGVRAAVSGRIYQSPFSSQRAGGTDTIAFTVPLVAAYDRQTVIGTITGTLDIESIARRVAESSALGIERRAFVLRHRESGSVIYSSRAGTSLSDPLRPVGTGGRSDLNQIFVGSEPYLAIPVASSGTQLERDPGFIAFGLAPLADAQAAADTMSDIFLSVAAVAAVLAMFFAWRWSTPLVEIAHGMVQTAAGKPLEAGTPLSPHATFGDMQAALASFATAAAESRRLAVREAELETERDAALAEAAATAAELRQLREALHHEISNIVEICELISKENLLAVSNKRHVSHARDLSRHARRLLETVEEAVSQLPAAEAAVPAVAAGDGSEGRRIA